VDEGPVLYGPFDPRPGPATINTDLFPHDEYLADESLLARHRPNR